MTTITTPVDIMPRDDLSIDFVKGNMPANEALDPALILDEWANRVSNLPEEIKFIQDEIHAKDVEIAKCLRIIDDKDSKIQKWIKANGSAEPNPKEEKDYRPAIRENYKKAEELQSEKIKMTQRLQITMDRHLKWLDLQIKALYDRNEPGFTEPDNLPSILRPTAANNSAPSVRTITSSSTNLVTAAATSLASPATSTGPKNTGVSVRTAQTSQHVSSSAPTSPAATMIMKRGAREGSAGPSSGSLKGPRINSGLGALPNPSSGLARHSSLGPGTPKGHTATGVQRAGSAGPRTMLKGGVVPGRKGTPSGGVGRNSKKGTPAGGPKSGLQRVRKTAKNSPSSTADSELSDADSGASGDESDARTGGRGTPARNEGVTGGRAEGTGHAPRTKREDEDIYMDDDEGSDDRKYCLCQKVSFGDMIACDNDDCPYEWFHWSCVGLKSEPQQGGTWFCPVCSEAMKKKGK